MHGGKRGWEKQQRDPGPALPSHCVTLSRSLPLSEPWFLHIWQTILYAILSHI